MNAPANSPEDLARRFHETYERLAPSFGYLTREASAKPWAEVPEQNKRLMIAVCTEIMADAPDLVGKYIDPTAQTNIAALDATLLPCQHVANIGHPPSDQHEVVYCIKCGKAL